MAFIIEILVRKPGLEDTWHEVKTFEDHDPAYLYYQDYTNSLDQHSSNLSGGSIESARIREE